MTNQQIALLSSAIRAIRSETCISETLERSDKYLEWLNNKDQEMYKKFREDMAK